MDVCVGWGGLSYEIKFDGALKKCEDFDSETPFISMGDRTKTYRVQLYKTHYLSVGRMSWSQFGVNISKDARQ